MSNRLDNYELFNVIKYKVHLSFWFDHSLGARAEICQIFAMVQINYSEIIWPLGKESIFFQIIPNDTV